MPSALTPPLVKAFPNTFSSLSTATSSSTSSASLPIDFTWFEADKVLDLLIFEQQAHYGYSDYILVARILRDFLHIYNSESELRGAHSTMEKLSLVVKVMLSQDGTSELPFQVITISSSPLLLPPPPPPVPRSPPHPFLYFLPLPPFLYSISLSSSSSSSSS